MYGDYLVLDQRQHGISASDGEHSYEEECLEEFKEYHASPSLSLFVTLTAFLRQLMNAATVIGDEETLKGICDILDLDFDELKGQLEQLNESQNTTDAVEQLEGVVTDEQKTEAGTATVPEQ